MSFWQDYKETLQITAPVFLAVLTLALIFLIAASFLKWVIT